MLTIELPKESETRLRRRAAEAGLDAAEYAAQLVQRAVDTADSADALNTSSRDDLLHQTINQLLRRSAEILPALSGPSIDPKSAWHEIMNEKAQKQGLNL